MQLLHLPNTLQCHQLVHVPCAVPKSCKNVTSTLYPVALAVLQMWVGYNQSVRPCQSGLTLNVDLTAAAFVTAQPLAYLVAHAAGFANKDDLKHRPLSKLQVNTVNMQIRGIQVGGFPDTWAGSGPKLQERLGRLDRQGNDGRELVRVETVQLTRACVSSFPVEGC